MRVTGCIVQVEGTREVAAWHATDEGGLDALGARLAAFLSEEPRASLDEFVERSGLSRGRALCDWTYMVDLSNGFVELDAETYSFREFQAHCSRDDRFVSIDNAPSTDLETISGRFESFATREASFEAARTQARSIRDSLISRLSISDWDLEHSLQREEPVFKI